MNLSLGRFFNGSEIQKVDKILERLQQKHGGEIVKNIQNQQFRDKNSNLDFVYITNWKVYVMDVRFNTGIIRGAEDDEEWRQKDKRGNITTFKNPAIQMEENIRWLNDYLERKAVFAPLIIFSERCNIEQVDTQTYAAITVDTLESRLDNMLTLMSDATILTKDVIKEIYEKLKRVGSIDEK